MFLVNFEEWLFPPQRPIPNSNGSFEYRLNVARYFWFTMFTRWRWPYSHTVKFYVQCFANRLPSLATDDLFIWTCLRMVLTQWLVFDPNLTLWSKTSRWVLTRALSIHNWSQFGSFTRGGDGLSDRQIRNWCTNPTLLVQNTVCSVPFYGGFDFGANGLKNSTAAPSWYNNYDDSIFHCHRSDVQYKLYCHLLVNTGPFTMERFACFWGTRIP